MQKLIEIFRFDESTDKTSYTDFTVIVYRLDGDADLHGFSGIPSVDKGRQLFTRLSEMGVKRVHYKRKGRLKSMRVRI